MKEIIKRQIQMTSEEFEEKLGLKGIIRAEIDTSNCNNTLVWTDGVIIGNPPKPKELIIFTVREEKPL